MRALSIVLLLRCTMPGLGEIVETVLYEMTAGHLAHSAGDPHDEGSAEGEHGCTNTAHRCHCCPNQPAVSRLHVAVARALPDEPFPSYSATLSEGVASSVFRPPIG